jgi:hypothetical protein
MRYTTSISVAITRTLIEDYYMRYTTSISVAITRTLIEDWIIGTNRKTFFANTST